MSKRDYYETLGVERTASDDELKKAYRKMARQHHPDLQTGESQKKVSEEKFKEVNEAYETLSDAEKRKRYDMFGHAGAQQGGGQDGFGFGGGAGFGDAFNDIFEDFFGGQRGGNRAERGNDLQYNLELTFEEAVYGKEAKLKIPRWEVCSDCKGSGAKSAASVKTCPSCKGAGQMRFQQGFFSISRPCGQCEGAGRIVTEPCPACQGRQRTYRERTIAVHIPAGIESGMRLRLSNEGEHGVNAGPPGDLYVAITVKPHPIFQRQGHDILCEVPIHFVTAALGGKIEVPTLKGNTIIKIPAGTQQDKILRLKGLGIPSLKSQNTGDQLFAIKIQFLGPQHGTAVGAVGTVLMTNDGGATWTSQETQGAVTLFDVFFSDASTGWVVGNAGAIFQTTNGGQQWIDRTLPCNRTCTKLTDLLRVRFTDPQRGWIVGERGMVYRTIDSGFTWTEQGAIAKASLFGLSFPDGTQGWAGGENGTIVRLSIGR